MSGREFIDVSWPDCLVFPNTYMRGKLENLKIKSMEEKTP